MTQNIGRYFTLEELIFSQTAVRKGISNIPDATQAANLQALVKHVLDPLRAHLGRPIVVSSGFRSPRLNAAIGGVSTSQHCFGQAADIVVPGMAVADVVQAARDLRLPFDQLIDEFGSWTHISYGPRHRRQVLSARQSAGKTHYMVI